MAGIHPFGMGGGAGSWTPAGHVPLKKVKVSRTTATNLPLLPPPPNDNDAEEYERGGGYTR
jgi:hypothetical protein